MKLLEAIKKRHTKILITIFLIVLTFLWALPIFGLFVTSIRPSEDVLESGWWSIIPHREWVVTEELQLPEDASRDVPITTNGVTATFDEFREGIVSTDGSQRLIWIGSLNVGRIEVQERAWIANTNFTLDNYVDALRGPSEELFDPVTQQNVVVRSDPLLDAFFNSFIVTIPATVIPILIAALAAYAIAWMRFRARYAIFIVVVLLLVVPLQIALVPLLRDFNTIGINGTFLSVWIAHTGFGLPLATYLLYNYISQLPRETLESAFIDGASHITVFVRLVLPLSVPVIVSFVIFQFLWVWNDYLVASIFIGTTEGSEVLTQRLLNLQGDRGQDWHLLTAAAFVSIVVPLIVFLGLQRFFIRGLLAGSVKG